jgi:hypothetical protein
MSSSFLKTRLPTEAGALLPKPLDNKARTSFEPPTLDAMAPTVLGSASDTRTPRSRGNIFRAGNAKTAGNLAVLPP